MYILLCVYAYMVVHMYPYTITNEYWYQAGVGGGDIRYELHKDAC